MVWVGLGGMREFGWGGAGWVEKEGPRGPGVVGWLVGRSVGWWVGRYVFWGGSGFFMGWIWELCWFSDWEWM